MAPFSALLLLMALVLSFACCFEGVRSLVRLISQKERGATGFPELSLESIRAEAQRVPLLRGPLVKAERAHRDVLFKKQMPDAIRLLCMALDAGSSLVKALEYAANNMEEPLAGELKRTVWDLRAGHGFDEAMVHLRARTGGSEFAYLAVAMEIQHRSGGSLSNVLRTISGSLRKSSDLAESLRTQTAQGRLSARMVAIMPVLLMLVFSLVTPGYLVTFASSPPGVAMLVFAVLLEVSGVLWVRRTLNVDLSSHLGSDRS